MSRSKNGKRDAAVRTFKPYPKYKDSGVKWLGQIPAHWELRRLKTIASVALSNVDKKSVEGERAVRLCNYVDVYYHDHITPGLDFMAATATSEQVRRFSLRAGDVLITKDSESWTDIAVPSVVDADLPDVLCGYHLALVRPGMTCSGAFISREFSAVGPRNQFQIAANGVTRFGLGSDGIRTGLFATPPIDEQRVIATFLDLQTAKLDALVAKEQELIELLQEQRTALITEAVTRGFDPSVSMKDSGVDWLAEIPRHWMPSKIKRLFKQTKRQGYDDLVVLSVYRDHGVIEKSSRDDNFNRTPEDLSTYQLVQAGDLVINKMKAWQGSLGVSDYLGITSPDYVVYSPRHLENGRFLHYFLRNKLLAQVFLTMSNGIRPSQWRLEPERFENLVVFLPPLSEQAAICERIDSSMRGLNDLISRVGSAVDLIREFRAALISAVVTGKIDVRQEVA